MGSRLGPPAEFPTKLAQREFVPEYTNLESIRLQLIERWQRPNQMDTGSQDLPLSGEWQRGENRHPVVGIVGSRHLVP